ncbi:MAG: hypothetical protein COS34_13740 [Lysobacterales bacterium CG02_land_8_20_14_3_00_62_12]|nr:MAG: hypothetical protein COS34_13740 [Xanthomonadales bacterium CG02_land_8_20_14_3_00_62_12]
MLSKEKSAWRSKATSRKTPAAVSGRQAYAETAALSSSEDRGQRTEDRGRAKAEDGRQRQGRSGVRTADSGGRSEGE